MIWRLPGRVLDLCDRVRIVGILNVTPDSFFDGGRYLERQRAVEHALQMVEEGADIVDIGGESSRPPLYGQVRAVPAAAECERVVPVVEAVRRHSQVPLSIDTTKAEVARRALEAGADIVNDTSALRDDPAMPGLIAASGAAAVLMHRRGSPSTMQHNTHYDDLLGEVGAFLAERLEAAAAAGIARECLAVDPGIGFGKSVGGNRTLLRRLGAFAALGRPLLVGASRKSFIWKPLGLSAAQSLAGSLAAAVLAVLGGAHLLRVHDVGETLRAVRTAEAIVRTGTE